MLTNCGVFNVWQPECSMLWYPHLWFCACLGHCQRGAVGQFSCSFLNIKKSACICYVSRDLWCYNQCFLSDSCNVIEWMCCRLRRSSNCHWLNSWTFSWANNRRMFVVSSQTMTRNLVSLSVCLSVCLCTECVSESVCPVVSGRPTSSELSVAIMLYMNVLCLSLVNDAKTCWHLIVENSW